MNKKADISIEMIIVIALCILVLLVIAYFYSNPFIVNWIRNLPRYSYNDTDREVQLSPDQLAGIGCANLAGRIENNREIYISGKKTDLFLDSEAIRLLHKNRLIGSIRGNIVYIYPAFLDKYSQSYTELKVLGLPSIEELRLIHNSIVLEERYICKSDKKIDEIKENQKCIAKCSLYNGVCGKDIAGKIANGKLDCKDNELCYVSENDVKLVSDDLKLNHFYVYDLTKSSYQDREDLINKESLELYIGKHIGFSADTGSNSAYCYFLDSDMKFIYGSYIEKGPIPKNSLLVTTDYYHELFYSGEKIFEFVAWDPNNEDKKIIKRVKVTVSKKFPEGYEPAEIASDSRFKEVSNEAEANEFFYVFDVKKDWIWNSGVFGAGAITTRNYKIVRNNNEDVSIFAFDESEKTWHEMNCNPGVFKFGKSIYIKDIENSLSATFAKDKCKW